MAETLLPWALERPPISLLRNLSVYRLAIPIARGKADVNGRFWSDRSELMFIVGVYFR